MIAKGPGTAKLLICAGVAALLWSMPSGVQANDSVAHLGAGGLVLAQTDDIEMRSEDLYVSFDKISVRYRFYNKTDHDIETLVAFPMPDLAAPDDTNNYSLPTQQPENFLAFTTRVDGQPVSASVERKAYALGIDRTAELTALNVPLGPHLEATSTALDALSPAAQASLLQLGLARVEKWDAGQGMERHVLPNWTLKTTYYWTQVFPAQTELSVEHEYQPSVGASAGSVIGQPGMEPSDMEPMMKRYCIDEGFVAAARRMRERLEAKGDFVTERNVEYILKTGSNWSGPIRDFRLVVDKGSPNNIVSFCAEGLTRISPTQFEMRKSDYWPGENLDVLLLLPGSAQN